MHTPSTEHRQVHVTDSVGPQSNLFSPAGRHCLMGLVENISGPTDAAHHEDVISYVIRMQRTAPCVGKGSGHLSRTPCLLNSRPQLRGCSHNMLDYGVPHRGCRRGGRMEGGKVRDKEVQLQNHLWPSFVLLSQWLPQDKIGRLSTYVLSFLLCPSFLFSLHIFPGFPVMLLSLYICTALFFFLSHLSL